MGAFTYAMPRCVWMPHWLRQRDAASAAAVLLSFCRVSLTWLACLSNCLSLCFPHFHFFLSLSLCLCVWKVLPVSVTASLHLSIYVYLRLCLRVCVSWAYVCVCCVCLYVATAHISFIKWQHDICKWNFPSTHLELPLPLPLTLLLLMLPLPLPQPSIAEIDSQTDRLTFKQHFCIERI